MKEKWGKIDIGMNYSEVKSILGPPTKILKNYMDGNIVKEGAYSWHVQDDEEVMGFILSVYNGKVRTKTEPVKIIPDKFNTPKGVIEKNASKERVKNILGEPERVNRFSNGESWFYELEDGKTYIVTFEGEVVLSITKKN
jgi:hypothetical protein